MTTSLHLTAHASNTLLALDLARKEAVHLHYSHTNMQDAQSFLEGLQLAQVASQMLFDVITKIESELRRLGVH
jgi:hypothetical protein